MAQRLVRFTEGSIPRHLVVFSTPMLLGNLLQALYNTVDSVWVGRFLGPWALAAVSISFPILFALGSLAMGLAVATSTLVAQAFGAQDLGRVRRTAGSTLVLLLLAGAVSSAAGILLRDRVLLWIGTPADILAPARDYLGIFLLGLAPMFLFHGTGAILRGLGDSRTFLRVMASASTLNIVLDPLFILGAGPMPAMGVTGAALATLLSQALGALLILRQLWRAGEGLRPRTGDLRLDPEVTRLTFRIGLPAGTQQVLVSFSLVALTAIVNRFGSVVVAGFGAAGRLDQFAFLPAFSVSLAVSAMVGQNLGAGRSDRVRETVLWSCLMAGGLAAVTGLLAIFRPQFLLGLFTTDPQVLAVGARYLRFMGGAYVVLSLTFTLQGVLRGAGDTMAALLITVISLWLVRIPLAHVLSSRERLGADGIWLAIALSTLVGLGLTYAYYRGGRWKQKVLIQRGKAGSGAGAWTGRPAPLAGAGPALGVEPAAREGDPSPGGHDRLT